MTCYNTKGENQIIRGLFSELVDRLVEKGGAFSHKDCRGGDSYSAYRPTGHIGVTPFDYEVMKTVTDEMCLKSGVRLLYHTTLLGCEKIYSLLKTLLSADKYAFAAVRVMPPCIAMGEAAGITAAMAAAKNISASDVSYKEVQQELIARGAYLE